MPTDLRAGARTLSAAALLLLALLVPDTAAAASLESLVMPGPVITGHAKVEDDCKACHDPFDAAAQRGLCLDCHEPVRKDIAAKTGFHGRSPEAATAPCKSCHTEHQGRDADITGLQPELFDHALTDFPLESAHAELICAACHESGDRPATAPTACSSCHGDADPHGGRLGSDCASCHEATRWDQAAFDHAKTDFPLTGAHDVLECAACHDDSRFESAGGQCIDCHRGNDVHAGARGEDCASCHTTAKWNAEFDHRATTGFALRGAHGKLECGNCHVAEPDYGGLATQCSACHSGDDAHRGRNGADCGACHGEESWDVRFDHAAKTGFELRGGHATLACAACHTGSLEDPLPRDCGGCHAADNPHGDALAACADCHDEATWKEAPRFQHDRADFALVGMHRAATCEQCHESLAFAPVASECRDCHADADVHAGAFGTACATCHNPVGWRYTQFDHARETDFTLAGAHADLACAACHAPGEPFDGLDTTCISCHRADDVHAGSFGQECDRCHDPGSFKDPAIPRRGVDWRP